MIENPTKIFPCDCMGEGLVVVKQDEDTNDCIGGPFIEMGFWNFGHVSEKRDWKWRLRTCWYILRKGTCWTDMVIMKARTAKNFAYHIIYLLSKDKERKQQGEPLVKEPISFMGTEIEGTMEEFPK